MIETDIMLRITEETQPSQEVLSEEPHARRPFDFGQACAYLSNERVFLAWIWTGLMLMGFGVAVAKMRIALTDFSDSLGSPPQSDGSGEIGPVKMGMWFLSLGLLAIIMGAYRYLVVQNRIRNHTYHPSNISIYILLLSLLFSSGLLILHVLLLH